MKKRLCIPFIVSLSMFPLTMTGCTPSASDKPATVPESSVQVDAPDTQVEVGDGVQVDAPGVEVKVGGGDGVQVDAPGVKIDLGNE